VKGDVLAVMANLAAIAAALPVGWAAVRFLQDRARREVQSSLSMREAIAPRLEEYLNEYRTQKPELRAAPALRLLDVKNFFQPHQTNDGFPHKLWTDWEHSSVPNPYDSRGIYFSEWIEWVSITLHRSNTRHNKFVLAEKGDQINGYTELEGPNYIITMLPFGKIQAFDFYDRLVYEPVIYVRNSRNPQSRNLKIVGIYFNEGSMHGFYEISRIPFRISLKRRPGYEIRLWRRRWRALVRRLKQLGR